MERSCQVRKSVETVSRLVVRISRSLHLFLFRLLELQRITTNQQGNRVNDIHLIINRETGGVESDDTVCITITTNRETNR